MKQLKTAFRSTLTQNNLQNLMRISMHGNSVKDYDPSYDVIVLAEFWGDKTCQRALQKPYVVTSKEGS
jgi:hypothetical protein